MADNRKNISFGTRRGKPVSGLLHVEVPGAIVNIRTGLHNVAGQNVTAVEIIGDEYSGEPAWRIPTFFGGEAKSLYVRVVEDKDASRVGEPATPDVLDLSRLIGYFEVRFPLGYVHTTFASSAFNSGVIEYSYSNKSTPDGFIYFATIQQAMDDFRKAYDKNEGVVS